jgi:hypothetical protein
MEEEILTNRDEEAVVDDLPATNCHQIARC